MGTGKRKRGGVRVTGKDGGTKDYDLVRVFDDSIDFVLTEEKKGYDHRTKKDTGGTGTY